MESITLQTNDSIISSGDSIGQLQFAASNESDGSASRYVIGKIYAQGEGAFNASSNPASIVFATSAADNFAASGKIKISHEGHILPLDDNVYDLGSSSERFRHLYVADTVTSPTGDLSYLFFDTTVGDVDQVAGQMNWNSEAGTVDLGLTSDVKISLGQSLLFRVKNSTGSTITKGEAVYASGVLGGGQIIQAAPFAADESVDEVRFIGLMTDDLANGSDGYVNNFGHIKNVDLRTSNTALNPNAETWAVGDILFVDDTSPGGLTKVQPKDDIYVAMVLADGQNGELFVRITDPGHINDLHDVNTSGVQNGQYLKYDSNSEVWKPGDPWKTLTSSDFTEVIGSGYYFQAENNGRYVLPYKSIIPLIPYEILDPSGTSGANYSLFIQNGAYYKIGGITYDIGELNKKIINREYRSGFGAGWYSVEYTNHEHTVSQITDINTSGLVDNNLLVWNSGADYWEPTTGLTFDGTTLHVNGSGNITGNMIVGGNLTIQGSTVTANVSTMEIEDPIFTLGLASGTIVTDTNLDRGLALALNNDVMAFMGWDTSENEFSLLSSGVASNGSGNYAPGTYGDLHIGALTATAANFSSTIDAANLGAGEDNSVVILDSDGKLRTDEIDSRVWGSSLVDGAGAISGVAVWSDTNTLTYDTNLIWDSTNDRLGIRKSNPEYDIDIYKGGLGGNATLRLFDASNSIALQSNLGGTLGNSVLQFGTITDNDSRLEFGYKTNAGSQATDLDLSYNYLDTKSLDFTFISASGNVFTYDLDKNNFGFFTKNIEYGLDVNTTSNFRENVYASGNVGIGTASPSYKLDVVGSGNFTGDVSIDGHLSASTKSFLINHPTRPGHKLQYGSLESPYHGIRLTGRGKIQSGWCVIKLPEYICELVRDNEDINIQITNYKHSQVLYVSDIDIANNEFTIKTNSWLTRNNLEFFWTFTAARKDVEPLKVEF